MSHGDAFDVVFSLPVLPEMHLTRSSEI